MPNILVEIEEETYKELNKVMQDAEETVKQLVLAHDMLLLVAVAVKNGQPLSVVNDVICVDGVPLERFIQYMKESKDGE